MKKILCLLLSLMIVSITAFTPILGANCSYVCIASADEVVDSLSDSQKENLAIATYYNYRKGWFTSTSSASVIGVLASQVTSFYNDSANTTGIHSTADFVTHITVDNSSGHWKISLDNTGIKFLDNLCRYILGKGEFPNLFSGGSWGSNGITTDNAYDGMLLGDTLFYVVNGNPSTVSPYGTTTKFLRTQDVKAGIPPQGQYAYTYLDQFKRTNPHIDFSRTDNTGGWTNVSVTLRWAAGVTNSTYIAFSQGTGSDLKPYLTFGTYDRTGYLQYNMIYSQRISNVRGNPALFLIKPTNNPPYKAYGIITYDYSDGYYYIVTYDNFYNNDVVDTSVNLQTDDFDHDEVAPDNNTDGVEFEPKYTDDNGSTYNYYNNNTVNNFYETYYNDYRQQKTIINKPSSGGSDPGGGDNPSTPGGESPHWDNSGTAGTLTPDGNGGYDLSLPDITIPDLDINWSISGLTEKFPFSIPFDLLAFFTVLNAEPETPKIEGTIDLGIVDWEIDWDLHAFDTLAALLRNLEFIGFCIALILITRNLIKG